MQKNVVRGSFPGLHAVMWSATVLVAACSSNPPRAPVIERSPSVIAQPGVVVPSAPAAPASRPDGRPATYVVKKGDTIYSIAAQFGVGYRDLASWNNIDTGYGIRIDQVLRVVPPGSDAMQSGVVAQTSPVVIGSVEQRPLGNAAAPASSPAPASGDVPLKNYPSGEKRPYSDAALAELSKPDSTNVVAAPPPVASTLPSAAAAPPTSDSEDDNIGWIWPASGKVIEEFAEGRNKGVDIAGKAGTPVLAAGAGKVLYVGNGIRGLGNLVVVKHSANFSSVYAHNSKILVTADQTVTKGMKIAEMGDSDADQVKLHFEIRRQGTPVDPAKYLPRR